MSHLTRAREVFDIELAALRKVRDRLDASFDAAVGLIVGALESRGKIVVVGIGKSGNIAQKLAATFSSTGTVAVFLHGVDAMHGDLGVVHDGDVALVLSYSGESDEIVSLLPALKRFAVKVVAITGSPRSTVARHSDLVLNIAVPREACPFNLAPTSSSTAMLVLGDALAMSVLAARGFDKESFARLHPKGAIGRSLLYRVRDIMRGEGRFAVAPQDTRVQEALWRMTRAKCGSVCVVNGRGRLVGVFTDGDLRRQMAESHDVLQVPLARVMTARPITVREDALAAEALRIFDERSIDDLIVVNARHQPVGLVDSQDLPKLKLM